MKRSRLIRKTPMARGEAQLKRVPLKAVSKKRRKVNDERRQVVAEIKARRPMCGWLGCGSIGDDAHEIWTRARSGQADHALLCPENIVMLCRKHHDEVETNQAEARSLGLIRHGHEGCPCGWKGKS